MDKLGIILDKINALLKSLFLALGIKILSVIPAPIKNFSLKTKTFFVNVGRKIRFFFKTILKRLKKKFLFLKELINSEEFKSSLAEKKSNVRESVKKHGSKAGMITLVVTFGLKLKEFKVWFMALSPKVILTSVSLGAFLSICGINAFYSGKRIYNETMGRKPASVQEIAKGRPVYYKRDARQSSLNEITLPIYAKTKAGEISRLLFDFNIQFSNRYLVHMMRSHESEIKSYINTELQPFTAGFPFTLEGKQVIKDKVKIELNKFLKEKKVEGHVEEIYIDHIIAG
jgi:flagellar basal body-associated protein FliL